jgi:hypothetical protein
MSDDQASGYVVAGSIAVAILLVTIFFFLSDCYVDDACRLVKALC